MEPHNLITLHSVNPANNTQTDDCSFYCRRASFISLFIYFIFFAQEEIIKEKLNKTLTANGHAPAESTGAVLRAKRLV